MKNQISHQGMAVLIGINLLLVTSVQAIDVSFDNDVGDGRYLNATNWSDDATVPSGGGYTGTATISNHNVSVDGSVFITGTNAILEILNGSALTVSNLITFGVGGDFGSVGARVIVASNAVLQGLGAPNSGTAGLLVFNPGGGLVPSAPVSIVELQPGATLSNLTVFRQSQTPGDKWIITAEDATIRAIGFAASASDSPSFFLTNTTFIATGGSTQPKMRNGQTLSYVRTTPTAPSFSLSVISIDDRPASGTNGGHLIISGGGTLAYNTASGLNVGTATSASGATSTVTLINGARFRSGNTIHLGANSTQDFNDDNGSTVLVTLADNAVLRTDRYLALGSKTSISGTGTVEIVPFAAAAGFFTFQTDASLFQGENLTFFFNPEGTVTPTFEVAGKDFGAEVTIDDVTTNFFLGALILTNSASVPRTLSEPHLRLLDDVDNAGDGAIMDALYVGNLSIASNTIVDLNFKNLYYFNGPQQFEGVTFLNAPFGGPIFIPEPSMSLLLALAAALLAARRKRWNP